MQDDPRKIECAQAELARQPGDRIGGRREKPAIFADGELGEAFLEQTAIRVQRADGLDPATMIARLQAGSGSRQRVPRRREASRRSSPPTRTPR